jgi:hypothetical protein
LVAPCAANLEQILLGNFCRGIEMARLLDIDLAADLRSSGVFSNYLEGALGRG